MSLTVPVKPEVEEWLRVESARSGMTPEELAARTLEARWAVARQTPPLSAEESELLAKINEGFPDAFWQRYRELIARRTTSTLTEEERSELIGLSDQVEEKNLHRAEYLLALSRLRGVPLTELIEQLGLRPTPVNG